jgi:hypothetical protein
LKRCEGTEGKLKGQEPGQGRWQANAADLEGLFAKAEPQNFGKLVVVRYARERR